VGNFDRTPLQNSSGVTGAAPIFHDVMLAAQARLGGRAPARSRLASAPHAQEHRQIRSPQAARQGRNGHGIWLHGTPRDTYSRPPRASDGCVVLANEDLDDLAKRVEIGVTPVVIADRVEWIQLQATQTLRATLNEQLDSWRADWESRNMERYLQHYSRAFSAESTNLTQWSTQKRRVNANKDWIKVRLSATSVFLYPGRDDLAVINFLQDYSSSNLSNKMRKRQYWIREAGTWKILYEGPG
jgi:murein L,D-transpeptidase YafK